jgi:trans-aconitate methyltransferase
MTEAKAPRKAATKEAAPGSAAAKPVQVRNTVDLWSGAFGDQYTERNRVDWRARIPFWQSAIEYCTPATVFEFGCNAGWNLRAIQAASPNLHLYGADVNLNAVNEARAQGLEVQHVGRLASPGLYEPGSMDLVFTAGVLIHVPSSDLERTMRD